MCVVEEDLLLLGYPAELKRLEGLEVIEEAVKSVAEIGRIAIGIGGAYGKGLVIAGDKVVGTTSLSQISIGLSLGGQSYAEFIFFKDSLFRRGASRR